MVRYIFLEFGEECGRRSHELNQRLYAVKVRAKWKAMSRRDPETFRSYWEGDDGQH